MASKDTWYMSLIDSFKKFEWPINDYYGPHFVEFYNKLCPYRSITLRRRNYTQNFNHTPDPKDPPIVFSLWSHNLPDTLCGYLEEGSIYPASLELAVVLHIFRSWFLTIRPYGEVQEFCQKYHPQFFKTLPEHRKNPAAARTKLIKSKLEAKMGAKMAEDMMPGWWL